MYQKFCLFKIEYISNKVPLSKGQNSRDIHLVSVIISFNVIVGSFSIYQ